MRVGIVTYFDIANYGSVLQAYALKTVLEENGVQSDFIRIYEGKAVNKYLHKIFVGTITARKLLTSSTARKVHFEIRNLKKKTLSGISEEKKNNFSSFVDNNFSSITLGRLELARLAHTNKYDYFICGSDQIWSPLSLHLSGYKYLDFAPANKRIAYAPSFGVSAVPKYNRKFVAQKLKGIKYLSVREDDGATIIKELINKDAPVLLDPTMLLDGNTWRHLYRSYGSNMVLEPKTDNFCLCYFFDEPSNEICQQIVAYAKKNGSQILVLSINNKKLLSNGAKYIEADPWEFLWLIDNSRCVFTNSFHGSVFALQFAKPLLIFKRKHSDTVKQTSRIDTLLKKAGIEDCKYVSGEIKLFDTSSAAERLIPHRKESIDFLKSSLGKVMKNE